MTETSNATRTERTEVTQVTRESVAVVKSTSVSVTNGQEKTTASAVTTNGDSQGKKWVSYVRVMSVCVCPALF